MDELSLPHPGRRDSLWLVIFEFAIVTGQVENMIDGLLLGVIFLTNGCNLWAAVIAHGITDTVDFLLLFLGMYPSV